jgi:hypothetical protein
MLRFFQKIQRFGVMENVLISELRHRNLLPNRDNSNGQSRLFNPHKVSEKISTLQSIHSNRTETQEEVLYIICPSKSFSSNSPPIHYFPPCSLAARQSPNSLTPLARHKAQGSDTRIALALLLGHHAVGSANGLRGLVGGLVTSRAVSIDGLCSMSGSGFVVDVGFNGDNWVDVHVGFAGDEKKGFD